MKPRRSNVPSLVCVFSASATTGGALYAFGMYAEAIKQTLLLSQSQLNTISAAMFIAGLFSWIPGLIVDRFGTRFSFSLGGLLGTLSTLAYWVVARQFIVIGQVVLVLSILGMLICVSCAMIVGSVFKIILVSCGPGSKGVAVGIAKAYVGLGAGVYTCVFQAIRSYNETPLDFLPMSSFFFFILTFLPGIFILPTKQQVAEETIVDDATPFHFRCLYLSLVLVAVVVIGSSIADLFDGTEEQVRVIDEKTSKHKYSRAAFILLIWLGPFVALLLMERREKFLDSKSSRRQKQKHADKEAESDQIADALFMASPLASSHNMLKAFSSNTDLQRELSFISTPSDSIFGMLGTPKQSFHEKSRLPGKSGSASALIIPPITRLDDIMDKDDEEDEIDAHEETFLLADIEAEQAAYSLPPPPPPPVPQHDSAPKDYLGSSAEYNYTLIEMLRIPGAWLMLWTCTIVVGSGTLQVNNMGEMVASRGFPDQVAPACLALFSVAQATARVVTGAVSEAALSWRNHGCFCLAEHGIPRPFFLVIAASLACIAHWILSFGNLLLVFVIGSVLSGVAFGMVWPLMVLIVGEVFGLDNHGANYMFYE